MPRPVQDKVRESSWQGQGKVKERFRQGQGKMNVRLKQSSQSHNYNLMGLDTIEINLVFLIIGLRKFLNTKS